MSKRIPILTALVFVFVVTAQAHRLNEFLQATAISLSQDRVQLRMNLTAGSDIAKKILMIIDTNEDGEISEDEKKVYANATLKKLSLAIDADQVPLQLISWDFPTEAEIKDGLGEIKLIMEARFTNIKSSHQLIFENDKQPMKIYLVNCILPADTSIHVIEQSRNADQSVYQLTFTTKMNSPSGGESQQAIKRSENYSVVKTYLLLGIEHILTGYDHLLFLCALVLGATGLWNLIKIITAFTIAHSITLTLATFGLAHLPEYIVEPLISASIVFVAAQNIFWPKQANSNSRIAVAFLFGLFHGLGFASGLLEVMHAMPTHLIIFALLGFSIGVEAGNQLVLLPLYSVLQIVRRNQLRATRPQRRMNLQKIFSGVVAVAGIYYLCIAIIAHV